MKRKGVAILVIVGILSLLLVMLPASGAQAYGNCYGIGGPSRLCDLAYDANHDILYGGTSYGGLWKYHNGKWSKVGGAITDSLEVSALLYDSRHDALYVATQNAGYGQGVYKCHAGQWTKTPSTIDSHVCFSLAYDPNHDILYAGSTDHGTWMYQGGAWYDISEGSTARIRGLFFDSIHNVLYAALADGVFARPGSSWQHLGKPGNSAAYSVLYNASTGILYAGSNAVYMYKGGRWKSLGLNSSGTQIRSMLIDPLSGTIYVGRQGYGLADYYRYEKGAWHGMGYGNDEVQGFVFGKTYNEIFIGGWATHVSEYIAPRNYTWYLAEGTTAWGFNTRINIMNPYSHDLTAQVTYMPTGAAKVSEEIKLSANSQTTLTNDHLRQVVGEKDFSTKVECEEGDDIAVDRTMIWTGPGAASPEGHSSTAVTSASPTWFLPEGSSAWGFECWLLLQNPNNVEASCDVTYMIENEGPRTFNKKIPANSRKSFDMSKDIGSKDASIKVVSNVPVIAERSMYRNNRREGSNSIGTTTPTKDYYLAEGCTGYGFTTYVLIQNPQSTENDVTVTYMTGKGPVVLPTFKMSPNSRKTIDVNSSTPLPDPNFSTSVHGSEPLIAERAMYWHGGPDNGEACHDSIGLSGPHQIFFLADGQADDSTETWTLVQNPNDVDVKVEIDYLTASDFGGGARKLGSVTETVPLKSRKTFNMGDKVSGRCSILVTCTSGKQIMVERAMYWNNRGAGTDTIGGYRF